MTILSKITKKLESKQYAKFQHYLSSFYYLTSDEQVNVLKKHEKFKKYVKLSRRKMGLICEQLQKALSIGCSPYGASATLTGGGVLQVESLDITLKAVTFII